MLSVLTRLYKGPGTSYDDPNLWATTTPSVRPSSFPFCGRRHVALRNSSLKVDDFTAQSSLYTEQGRAIHSVIQNMLLRTGSMFGYARCARPSCKAWYADRPMRVPADARCAKCGSDKLNYEELRLSDEHLGLAMHLDGVLINNDGLAVLVEIKSAEDAKVKWIKRQQGRMLKSLFADKVPWVGYLAQATTYRAHLALALPQLKYANYILYIVQSRDQPRNFAPIRVPYDATLWPNVRQQIYVAMRADKASILPMPVSANVNHPACNYCQLVKQCKSRLMEKRSDEPQVDVKYDALFSRKARDALDRVSQKQLPKQVVEVRRGH